MTQVYKSLLAEKDLINVWLYTLDNWGACQADKYLDQINNAVKTIPYNPDVGIACNEIREAYMKYHINKHVIFYRHTNKAINIIRLLSDKMDGATHL